MHLRRALLTIALAAVPVVAATPAVATTCPQITDVTGDSTALAPTVYSADVDIVSADVASGTNNVHAELRVAGLETDLAGNFAPRWDLRWSIDGTDYTAQVRRVLVFNTYVSDFFVNNVSAGPVPFTVDVTTDTISWTIPRTLLPDLTTPGGTFTDLKAVTFTLPSVANSASDVATSTETYVDQTAGCISAS